MEESSLRRIEKFKESLARLKKLSEKKEDMFLSDFTLTDSLERNIQTVVEAVMDIARKIISSMEWEVPTTYKEVVSLLHEKNVIDEGLSTGLTDLVGLRNILVHLYAEVKLDLLLDDLEGDISVLEKSMDKLIEFSEENDIDP